MKTYKLIVAGMLGVALSIMPVYAQRGGGVSRSGGGHSTSVSRSSGGFSGSSRSSSSYSSSRSSSYSSPRSSSSYSSSRSSSYSAPRSSARSSYNNSRSSFNSSRSNSYNSSRGYSTPRSSSSVNGTSAYRGNSATTARHTSSPISRSAAMAASRGNSSMSNRTGSPVSQRGVDASRGSVSSRSNSGITSSRSSATGTTSRNGAVSNTSRSSVANGGRPGTVDNGRPSGAPNRPLVNGTDYARPGHPGVLPPSAVPIQPAPYFYCPYYDAVLYMHLVPWYAPVVVRPIFWPGFWVYCNSYWYDYHPTDVVVVREYVDRTYGVDLIAYAISGPYMYALVNDNDGYTYLQVFDENDHLLAEQQVHRKYRDMSIDRDNGGCWITKKNGKDPLLFFYNEGQLLIYETND